MLPRRASILLLGIGLVPACQKDDGGIVVFDAEPSVVLLEPANDSTFEQNEPILFRAKIADDGPLEDLTVQWSSDLDGILPSTDVVDPEGNLQFSTAQLASGTHIVTLRAIDGAANQGEAHVTLHIEEVPDFPSIVVDHPLTGENGLEATAFVFGATVFDFQDNPEDLQIELSANPGGVVCYMIPDGNGHGTCSAILDTGPYMLTFLVTDRDGNEASAPAAFAVVGRGDYDADGDGFTPNQNDCIDTNPHVYPGAPEECDGLDNDCNEITGVDVGTDCYDDDMDGYCEDPPCVNASSTLVDCDDHNAPDVSPAGVEARNGVDDDCDGTIDETTTAYDDDGDGSCEVPPCVNAKSTTPDCDDGNFAVNSGAKEVCGDGIDNDCDLSLNELNAVGCKSFYLDNDADTYGTGTKTECWCDPGSTPYTSLNNKDCNDSDASVYPGSVAEVRNGLDDNCNGKIDEGTTAYDDDGDGFCEVPPCVNSSATKADCDDANAAVKPTASETCADAIDNDCDGLANEQNATACKNFNLDADHDGFGIATKQCWCGPSGDYTATNSTDCSDTNPNANPSAPEVLDGVDNNCNGKKDEGTTAYDDDGDGYCEQPPCTNTSSTKVDCDDAAFAVKPGATETCADAIDNDCDGLTNEQNATSCKNYYADVDADGYGSTTSKQCWCAPGGPGFSSLTNNDCDDNNANAHPGQTTFFTVSRSNNTYDYDCNGSSEKLYRGTATCVEDWGGVVCDPNPSTGGWDGSEKGCGNSGNWLSSCGVNYNPFCILGCGSNLTCIGGCMSCISNFDTRTQSCR